MNLTELEYANDCDLPAPTILSRVQRQRSRPGAVAIGPLRLPPRGLMKGRFDLADDDVGYFADSPETAIYETLARREATALSMSTLAKRSLLTLRTTAPLTLLDLRCHACAWPVLQSLRYQITQELAKSAREHGYQGIVFRSAQQYGSDCFALFGDALRTIRLESKLPLLQPGTGALHRAMAAAVRGSQIPLTP
jgi:hypothetical protein